GMLSYTDYLFLVCILTKPRAGFQVFFKMFDTDGNERVDKKEFMKVCATQLLKIFRKKKEKSTNSTRSGHGAPITPGCLGEFYTRYYDDCWCNGASMLRLILTLELAVHVSSRIVCVTTLVLHLFKDQSLSYQEFEKFMVELQGEVLLREFEELARGTGRVTQREFASAVLRYT
uniref:EF-hand domain-containing protein n=1 Tax=Petromyzon marinus TaxID=7757 RepID=S4RXH8_PETMA